MASPIRCEGTITRETDDGDVEIAVVFDLYPGSPDLNMGGAYEDAVMGDDDEYEVVSAEGDDGVDYSDDISDDELATLAIGWRE